MPLAVSLKFNKNNNHLIQTLFCFNPFLLTTRVFILNNSRYIFFSKNYFRSVPNWDFKDFKELLLFTYFFFFFNINTFSPAVYLLFALKNST